MIKALKTIISLWQCNHYI